MAKQVLDVMMSDPRKPKGMLAAYLLTEDAAGDVWGFAVFEDEQAYRANADDPAQGAQYQKFRARREADPERHDGSITQRPE